MKKIDLGQTITIFANIGVIAGIVFLAIELRQNNQLLRAEAIGALLETRMTQNEQISSDDGMSAILTKNSRQEDLTDEDLMRLRAFYARGKMGWQKDYFLFQEGILTEQYIRTNLPVMKTAFGDSDSTYSGLEHWETNWQYVAPEDYKAFIEQCVISDCDVIPR